MTFHREELERMISAVSELRENALALERAASVGISKIPEDHRASARNLLHYLAVRQHDPRHLQEQLAAHGLSSLGRMEAHTMASLDAVLAALRSLAGHDGEQSQSSAPLTISDGPQLLVEHTRALLGEAPSERAVRIMVTMPSAAAKDGSLCEAMLRAGMDVARINCAHDKPKIWLAMIDNLRAASKAVGRPCRIMADLQGPKLRTGPIEVATNIVSIKPRFKAHHKNKTPELVLLTKDSMKTTDDLDADTTLVLDAKIVDSLKPGRMLTLTDVRGKTRYLEVAKHHRGRYLATAKRRLDVQAGTPVRVGKKLKGKVREILQARSSIRLYQGDTLIVTGPGSIGRRAQLDDNGEVITPATIGCTLGAALRSVKPGDPIWFDDGKIGGRVTDCDDERLVVRIHHARYRGTSLRAEKGINLPRTTLDVAAFTDQDRADLNVLARHVDLVGLSFIRQAQDVLDLQRNLRRYEDACPGIVVKIENRCAFENLAEILLASLRSPPVGVIIARGDLAIEVGFERLAEIQEQILWLCEAAHIPVVWATQVLEDLARKGTPSRAEVTDAASGSRAECVMLNKGPHIVEAVSFLSNVLGRMADHQDKKFSRLRRLSVSKLKAES